MAKNCLTVVRLLLVMAIPIFAMIITVTAYAAAAQSYDPMCTESSSSSATTNGVYYYNRACSTKYLPWNSSELQGYVLDALQTEFHNYVHMAPTAQSRRYCDHGGNYGAKDRPVPDDLVALFSYASCADGYGFQECVECLDGASQLIRTWCDGSAGVRAWSEICCARYEEYYDFC